MKTETEATADNERIMPRFRALQREVTAASAEAVRLADAADAEADPVVFAASYRAMWRAYNEASAAGGEACQLFDSLFEVYRGYFDAAAVRPLPADFAEERRMWRKIMACYGRERHGGNNWVQRHDQCRHGRNGQRRPSLKRMQSLPRMQSLKQLQRMAVCSSADAAAEAAAKAASRGRQRQCGSTRCGG